MVGTYIAFTFLVVFVLAFFTIILLSLITMYDNMIRYNEPGLFKLWCSRIIILIICYFFINCTYSLFFKPRVFLSTDEPVLITGNNATYRYYSYFQNDSVDTIVHKPISMKGIVYKDRSETCGENKDHHIICIKSNDGKYTVDDYHYDPSFEDLPLEQYKKQVGFVKVFFPEERYNLVYFSK